MNEQAEKQLKPYCEKCGALCEMQLDKVGYSRYTGDALYHVHLRCPNGGGLFNPHADRWVTAYGSRMVYAESQLREWGVDV